MYPPPQQGYPHPHGGYPQNYSGGYAQDPQQPGGYGQPPPVGYGQQPGGYPYSYGQTVIVTQPQTILYSPSEISNSHPQSCDTRLVYMTMKRRAAAKPGQRPHHRMLLARSAGLGMLLLPHGLVTEDKDYFP